MSPFSQETEDDHGGAVGEEVMLDHWGAPERLEERWLSQLYNVVRREAYDMDVTAQPRWAAALQMRLPVVV
jgi:hypothetical protein